MKKLYLIIMIIVFAINNVSASVGEAVSEVGTLSSLTQSTTVPNLLEAMSVAFEEKLSGIGLPKANTNQYPTMEYEYSANIKHLAYLKASSILEIALFIDLDDYVGITGEGQEGWVTVWLHGGIDIGISAGVPFGLIKTDIGSIEKDPQRNFSFSGPSVNAAGFGISAFVYENGEFNTSSISTYTNSINIGAGASLTNLSWCLYRFEIQREALNDIIIRCSPGISSNLLTGLEEDQLGSEFLSFDEGSYIPQFNILNNYRAFTPTDSEDAQYPTAGGLIEYTMGGFDSDEDGIPDTFPTKIDYVPCSLAYWNLDIVWQSRSNITGDYYIEVGDLPAGWNIEAVNPINNAPVDGVRYYSDNVDPFGTSIASWGVCIDEDAVDNADVEFKLYYDNVGPVNTLLDQVVFRINKCSDCQMVVTGMSPIEVAVETPSDVLINKETKSLNSRYREVDHDSDGDYYSQVLISQPEEGNYNISVTPKSFAQPTDTYSIAIFSTTSVDTIVTNNQIQNIPNQPVVYNPQVPVSNGNCPTTVTYEGKTYNTVQIGDQCWFKENLDVGTMINSASNQTNDGTIEKYCYDNDPNNCAIYGGLYQWNEAMQYVTTEGTRGICPEDWHIPTKGEYEVLRTSANNSRDDLLAIGQFSGNNNTGFSALLAGAYCLGMGYVGLYETTEFWSSTYYNTDFAYELLLFDNYLDDNIYYDLKSLAVSIRCIKNEESSTAINDNERIPDGYQLSQNYPNPFNPSTNVTFSIPENSRVRLKLFNNLGEVVREFDKGYLSAGTYSQTFYLEKLPSGTYFYQLITDKSVITKKMLLIK